MPQKNFAIINQNVLFLFWGFQNFPFWELGPKKRPPPPKKHYKIGVSASHFFLKTVMHHETAIFGQKNQIQKFQFSIFSSFFSFNNKNTQKFAETPIL